MIVSHISQASGGGLWLLAGVCLPIPYFLAYAGLRLAGKLCVSPDGWHAGGVAVGSRMVMDALRVLALFQPLLRRESGLRRRLARLRAAKDEQPVSEVVVELVPMS